jgi:phosphate transport system permease protein
VGALYDWLFKNVCLSSGWVLVLVAILILVLLANQAWPAIRTVGLDILLQSDWSPSERHFGGLVFLYGSVVTSLLAMCLAVPFGVATAVYLAEIATGPVQRIGSFLVELLAAIPSVVYGFWGITFLCPSLQQLIARSGGANIGGRGLLSASLILAIMIVPYIAAISYDACKAVPRSQREGALALGAPRWQMIWGVVLPYARPGILAGCFLALGRALGETMAVTMIIGNVDRFESLPWGQGSTIPSVLAVELPSSVGRMHDSALIELALLLFGLSISLNALARFFIWRMGQPRYRLPLLSRLFGAVTTSRPKGSSLSETEPPLIYSRRAAWINRLMIGREGRMQVIGLVGLAILAGAAAMVALWVPDPQLRSTLLIVLTVLGVAGVLATLGVLGLGLVSTCLPLFLILGFIVYRGVGSLSIDFFTQIPRPMGETGGGLANALVGSLIIVSLATAFALPIGVLAAVYLAEYRTSRLGPIFRFVGELLGGVPSIVIGTFVYGLVRLLIRSKVLPPDDQFSGWAGAFALGCMMMPIIMRSAEEALKMVPQALRNASHALGAHHWQTVVRVSLPAALSAIITGIFLGIARIAGETAPLLMTAFGNERWTVSPGDKIAFLPLYIYTYATDPDENRVRLAWSAAFVLLTFVMLLNIGVRVLTGKRVVLASQAD